MGKLLIWVIVFIVVFLLVKNFDAFAEAKKADIMKKKGIRYLNTEADEDDCRSTYIAGMRYHFKPKKLYNFITGFAVPVNDNKYDANAVALFSSDGSLLGYVPKDESKEYRQWCGGNVYPLVGHIVPGDECDGMNNPNDENMVWHSNVKILKPFNEEYVKDETERYRQWFDNKFINSQ